MEGEVKSKFCFKNYLKKKMGACGGLFHHLNIRSHYFFDKGRQSCCNNLCVNSQHTQLHFMFEVMILIIGWRNSMSLSRVYRKNMFISKTRGGIRSEFWNMEKQRSQILWYLVFIENTGCILRKVTLYFQEILNIIVNLFSITFFYRCILSPILYFENTPVYFWVPVFCEVCTFCRNIQHFILPN